MLRAIRDGRQFLAAVAGTIGAILLCSCTTVEKKGEWRWYGSDQGNTKYAPLDQVDRNNVQRLRIAWRWTSVDELLRRADSKLWTWMNEATPVAVGDVLYTSTSMSQVAAIDSATGTTIWQYDPESYKVGTPSSLGFHHRGVAYWESSGDRRVIVGTGDGRLIALDATTGKPVHSFGVAGQIDIKKGLRRPVDSALYGLTSPPMICRGTIVVGASILDVDATVKFPLPREMPPGDVRGFDVRTGELRWLFESISPAHNAGHSAMPSGDVNVWTVMSCDEKLGYVYLPFGTATNDFYGGHRAGNNLFSESLVALDATTGKRIWHFQMVHHGLWDYDLPAAPNLAEITIGGRQIKAVAQVSKQGFVYVFDRITGQPVWPIEERPVPQSTVAGERSSPTQPFPTKPAPFDRQGVTREELIDFTPELRQSAINLLKNHTYGGLFTPPAENGTITVPGVLGGASWAGAALHPEKGILYVPSITNPVLLTVRKSEGTQPPPYVGLMQFGPVGPQGLPLLKPPYGRVTAIDLNTGEHLWMRAIGAGPKDHPALRHLDLPPLGWPHRIFVLLSKSLLFVAQEGAVAGIRGISPRGNAIEVQT